MQSNATITNAVLHDPNLHYQGPAFSCYSLAVKNALAPDVPGRFASTCMALAAELLLYWTEELMTSPWQDIEIEVAKDLGVVGYSAVTVWTMDNLIVGRFRLPPMT